MSGCVYLAIPSWNLSASKVFLGIGELGQASVVLDNGKLRGGVTRDGSFVMCVLNLCIPGTVLTGMSFADLTYPQEHTFYLCLPMIMHSSRSVRQSGHVQVPSAHPSSSFLLLQSLLTPCRCALTCSTPRPSRKYARTSRGRRYPHPRP